jgi:hypothetical protein
VAFVAFVAYFCLFFIGTQTKYSRVCKPFVILLQYDQMLKNNSEFMDRIDSLTERKMKSMNQKVMNAKASYKHSTVNKINKGEIAYKIVRTTFFIGGARY